MNKRDWMLANRDTKDPELRNAVDHLLDTQYGIAPPTLWRLLTLRVRNFGVRVWNLLA